MTHGPHAEGAHTQEKKMKSLIAVAVVALSVVTSACGPTPYIRPWARSNEEAAAWRAAHKKCQAKADKVRLTDPSNETETRATKSYEECMNGEGFYRIP